MPQGRAEGGEQGAIDIVGLGVVLSVPLDPQRETRRFGDANGLDRVVLRNPLHHHPATGLEDALPMERIDSDRLSPQECGEDPTA